MPGTTSAAPLCLPLPTFESPHDPGRNGEIGASQGQIPSTLPNPSQSPVGGGQSNSLDVVESSSSERSPGALYHDEHLVLNNLRPQRASGHYAASELHSSAPACSESKKERQQQKQEQRPTQQEQQQEQHRKDSQHTATNEAVSSVVEAVPFGLSIGGSCCSTCQAPGKRNEASTTGPKPAQKGADEWESLVVDIDMYCENMKRRASLRSKAARRISVPKQRPPSCLGTRGFLPLDRWQPPGAQEARGQLQAKLVSTWHPAVESLAKKSTKQEQEKLFFLRPKVLGAYTEQWPTNEELSGATPKETEFRQGLPCPEDFLIVVSTLHSPSKHPLPAYGARSPLQNDVINTLREAAGSYHGTLKRGDVRAFVQACSVPNFQKDSLGKLLSSFAGRATTAAADDSSVAAGSPSAPAAEASATTAASAPTAITATATAQALSAVVPTTAARTSPPASELQASSPTTSELQAWEFEGLARELGGDFPTAALGSSPPTTTAPHPMHIVHPPTTASGPSSAPSGLEGAEEEELASSPTTASAWDVDIDESTLVGGGPASFRSGGSCLDSNIIRLDGDTACGSEDDLSVPAGLVHFPVSNLDQQTMRGLSRELARMRASRLVTEELPFILLRCDTLLLPSESTAASEAAIGALERFVATVKLGLVQDKITLPWSVACHSKALYTSLEAEAEDLAELAKQGSERDLELALKTLARSLRRHEEHYLSKVQGAPEEVDSGPLQRWGWRGNWRGRRSSRGTASPDPSTSTAAAAYAAEHEDCTEEAPHRENAGVTLQSVKCRPSIGPSAYSGSSSGSRRNSTLSNPESRAMNLPTQPSARSILGDLESHVEQDSERSWERSRRSTDDENLGVCAYNMSSPREEDALDASKNSSPRLPERTTEQQEMNDTPSQNRGRSRSQRGSRVADFLLHRTPSPPATADAESSVPPETVPEPIEAHSAPADLASDADILPAPWLRFIHHISCFWRWEASQLLNRALFVAVRRDDVRTCKELITAEAEVMCYQADGNTPLHVAAASFSVDCVKLLVRSGADLGVRNRLGELPAHCLKLLPAPDVIMCLDLLAPSGKELLAPNACGASVLQRAASWAIGAQDNRPYMEATDRIFFLRGLYPDFGAFALSAAASALMASSRLLSSEIVKAAHTVKFGPYEGRVHVWESLDPPEVNILAFHHGSLLPWSIHKSALTLVAQHLCRRHRVRMLALQLESLPFGNRMSMASFNIHMVRYVDSLRLDGPLVLFASGPGPAVQLLWKLNTRLSGALVLNCSRFRPKSYLGSSQHEQDELRQTNLAGLVHARRIDVLTASLIHHNVFAHCPEDLILAENTLHGSYCDCHPAFWRCAEYATSWTVAQTTQQLQNAPAIKLPSVMVACGGLADTETHASTLRLQEKLVGSSVRYIPESCLMWELEGQDQQRSVAALLHDLLTEVTSSPHDMSRPVGDRIDVSDSPEHAQNGSDSDEEAIHW